METNILQWISYKNNLHYNAKVRHDISILGR
jgi:hypothetical protein